MGVESAERVAHDEHSWDAYYQLLKEDQVRVLSFVPFDELELALRSDHWAFVRPLVNMFNNKWRAEKVSSGRLLGVHE